MPEIIGARDELKRLKEELANLSGAPRTIKDVTGRSSLEQRIARLQAAIRGYEDERDA